MILLRFLKQQNWWYAVPCTIFLFSFLYAYTNLIELFIYATGFLICYSLKFAGKHNNEFIDRLKLFFYFLYFTCSILFVDYYYIWGFIQIAFPWFIFYLYFYTILIFYKRDMEEKDKNIKKSFWLTVVISQTLGILLVVVWAITQKVEADKQKVLAIEAQRIAAESAHKAEQAKENSLNAQEESLKQKLIAEQAKTEALKYQLLYEELVKRKK